MHKILLKPANSGKIKEKRIPLRCPYCQKHILYLLPETNATDLLVYCRRCKMEFIADIERQND